EGERSPPPSFLAWGELLLFHPLASGSAGRPSIGRLQASPAQLYVGRRVGPTAQVLLKTIEVLPEGEAPALSPAAGRSRLHDPDLVEAIHELKIDRRLPFPDKDTLVVPEVVGADEMDARRRRALPDR